MRISYKKSVLSLTLLCLFTCFSISLSTKVYAKENLTFTGGPAGGTFQIVASSIQVYPPLKKSKQYRIRAQSSAGSIENLRKVNSGKAQLGIIHSGHAYLGSKGELKNDKNTYENVLAVAHFYSSPAQLIVKKEHNIQQLSDLTGKKVGVGNAGSGAFANCELLFSHLQLWDKIKRNALGYNDAAHAFGNNQLDAFWLFTGYPSGAVSLAAQTNDIALVNLDQAAQESGFYKKYPYLTQSVIPANTYKGVTTDTPTFQDAAIWIANKNVSEETVYNLLKTLFSEEGLAYMVKQKSTFKAMTVENGVQGIVTPLHPGAKKFWLEQGIISK